MEPSALSIDNPHRPEDVLGIDSPGPGAYMLGPWLVTICSTHWRLHWSICGPMPGCSKIKDGKLFVDVPLAIAPVGG